MLREEPRLVLVDESLLIHSSVHPRLAQLPVAGEAGGLGWAATGQ